mmetsp:Transcript_85314/g.260848  ORF Transcript_85314/g.260848 Transcript_85314/m.260848 type:complete len:204 (-) Transcript_85314:1610-2221(-)
MWPPLASTVVGGLGGYSALLRRLDNATNCFALCLCGPLITPNSRGSTSCAGNSSSSSSSPSCLVPRPRVSTDARSVTLLRTNGSSLTESQSVSSSSWVRGGRSPQRRSSDGSTHWTTASRSGAMKIPEVCQKPSGAMGYFGPGFISTLFCRPARRGISTRPIRWTVPSVRANTSSNTCVKSASLSVYASLKGISYNSLPRPRS